MTKKKPNKIELDKVDILGDNILLEPIELEENETVIKPEQYEDKPEFGMVIGVGSGRITDHGEFIPTKIKVGDLLIFNKYSTTKIRVNGHDYLFIREEDILARQ